MNRVLTAWDFLMGRSTLTATELARRVWTDETRVGDEDRLKGFWLRVRLARLIEQPSIHRFSLSKLTRSPSSPCDHTLCCCRRFWHGMTRERYFSGGFSRRRVYCSCFGRR